ncbi:MAG: hypothetical protein WAU28_01700 [Candidatus Moraniibacteriota bacterium]
MKNPMEFPKTGDDPQEKQLEEIISFSKSNNISSEELFVSYQLAMGLSLEELELKQAPREEVFSLSKIMGEHMKNGLAVNRIAGLVESKKDYETAAETYSMMVDELKITKKEKGVLKSIVIGKRPGVITIINDETSEDLAEITILKEVESMEMNEVAATLIGHLRQYMDKKISIRFVAE